MKTIITFVVSWLGLMTPAFGSENRVVRFSELSPIEIQQMRTGRLTDVTVEFRQGDKVGVNFEVRGDFLQSDGVISAPLVVKTTFYVKVKENAFLLSLDGDKFHPLSEIVKREISVGVSGNPVAEIQLMLKALLK